MNNALTMPTPAPKAKSKSSKRGELNCIKIEPTDNGFSVCSYFDSGDATKDYGSSEEEEMSFESGAKALAYVTKMMQAHSAYESTDNDKPAA